MRRFRFTTVKLFLIMALCGLVAGLIGEVQRQGRHEWPLSVTFSPDGRLVLVKYAIGGAMIWDLAHPRPSPRNLFDDQDDVTASLPHFINDSTIAFATYDFEQSNFDIVVWDLAQSHPKHRFAIPYAPEFVEIANVAVTGISPTRTIDVWSLESGERTASLPLVRLPAGAPIDGAVVSADGRRIAFETPATKGEVWDIESQKRMFSFSVEQGHPMAFSRDGRLLVVTDGGKTDVWDVESRTMQASSYSLLPRDLIKFSPDGKTFASGSIASTIEIVDANNCQRIALIDIRDKGRREMFSHMHNAQPVPAPFAYSPDGRTIAVSWQDGVTLYNTRDYSVERVLATRSRSIPAAMFGAGFFVWSVIWGLWSRRERRRLGVLDGDQSSGGERPLPRQFRYAINPWGTLLKVNVVVLAVSVLIAFRETRGRVAGWGINYWLTFLIFVAICFVAFWAFLFGLFLLRRFVIRPTVGLFVGRHKYQIKKVEKVAGGKARRVEFGPVTACFFGSSTLEPIIEKEFIDARERFENVVGQRLDLTGQPLLVLCFEQQETMDDFFGGQLPVAGGFVPYRERLVVLSEHGSLDFATLPSEIFRNLMAFYFFHCQKRFLAPPWLSTALAWLLESNSADLRRVHRRLRSTAATAPDKSSENSLAPFSMTNKELIQLILRQNELESDRKLSTYLGQCASLGTFLTHYYADRFRKFVQDVEKRSDVHEVFRRHFDRGFAEMADEWRAWAGAQPVDFEPVPEMIRRHHVERLLPVVRDKNAPLVDRRRAILRLSGGYLTGADALIDILRDDDQRLHVDAAGVLESISGEKFGCDVSRWQSWWDRHAEAAAHVDSMQATTQVETRGEVKPSIHQRSRQGRPPRSLKVCEVVLGISGVVGIALSMATMFSPSLYWQPWFAAYSLVAGVFAVAIAAGRATNRLRFGAWLQIISIVNGNLFNCVLGGIILMIMHRKDVRQHVQATRR